ncbi:class A beta-lactamase [Streptomyces sp. NBC_01766]|uniref:class A beta-lactamase n=1 Tax=Streptomyces sp. NBC_01766 TaxID=2975936 RepID=UPI002DDA4730|nr:class A beta-lactamase [Streptomyces sp. NBC_01766]WSC24230.1 class A beta-lactamase [Streptomyces sp. NBC_01766]
MRGRLDILESIRVAGASRRAVLAGGLGAALTVVPSASAAYASVPGGEAVRKLRDLEQEHDARLGAFGWNTATGRRVSYRADELFPLCSTSKTPAVGAVLRDLDRDGSFLRKVIHYTQQDIDRSGGAPITGLPDNLARGMTVEDLCGAALSYSDNTAINLLLAELGGPASVTRFCRSIGDTVTRLDRWEPELNSAEPGRTTDTTTPHAIGMTYARLALGNALEAADRERLTGWLLANTTGDKRLRAGLPEEWTVGDKTGTGSYGTANDVGIAWPPGQGPIVLAVLSTKHVADATADDSLIAETATVLASALMRQA